MINSAETGSFGPGITQLLVIFHALDANVQ